MCSPNELFIVIIFTFTLTVKIEACAKGKANILRNFNFPLQYIPMPSAVSPSLAWAHPLVQEWFTARFSTPTEPQEQGWPHILAGHTTLISAPTGSGKTLAAFLACIDRLVCKALAGELRDRTEVLYVSPLKALGNDIQKNLEIPLGEILQMAGDRGLLMPEIRTAVRTGDTLMKDRRLMLKRPPHILVTTPESFYILLTAEKSRAILRDVETVIVDEIHAVADDKRGVHLALSLERLEALTERPPVRIGLSATQKPIEDVAHFLAGSGRPDPVIVNVGHKRTLDLGVEVPSSELGPVASNEMWDEIYERIVQLVNAHRSTLVFVNTRRLAERISHQLGERLGEDNVAAHHGSLSRKLRLEAERRLKEGQIKVLVATASLELGIDIGTVDLVCHISSPRSIAVALQRVGRSGHWRGAVPKGRFFVTTRDDLAECAVLVRAIHRGELDRLIFPEASLDVPPRAALRRRTSRAINRMTGGTKMNYSRSQGGPIPIAISRARRSTPCSRCFRKESLRNEAATAHTCITTASITSYGRGVERAWRQSPAAVRFPITRCSRWLRNLTALSWGRWMKTSPPKAWPGKSCCWGTRRGASGESSTGRGVCWWKMRMAQRPAFPSGWARGWRGLRSFQP